MKTITIKQDIPVLCVKAKSFPHGVLDAHKKLHNLFPPDGVRKYYGISHPEKGEIIYFAAVSQQDKAEAQKKDVSTFTIKRGQFLSKEVKNFTENELQIKEAFDELLATPNLNKETGYCLEEYVSDDDVVCMVPLRNIPAV